MGDLRVGFINVNGYQTPNDVRLFAQAAFMPSPNGALVVRTGLVGSRDQAGLTGATAMQADIDPFVGVIAGTESGDQGAYPVALKAQKRLTWEAGESAIARVDRVIAHVQDADYDGGSTYDGDVEVLKGDPATGAATALPPDSMLLWEVTVPAGTSAGGSGIPWASAVADKRQWTTTAGGALPVESKADRDAIVAPHDGFAVCRLDLGVIEVWDGALWRTQGVPVVDAEGDLADLDQYDGQLAVVGTDLVVRDGGAWIARPRGLLAARQCYQVWPATSDNSALLNTLAVIGSAYPAAGNATLPMQFDVELNPDRCYRLDGFIDTVDTGSEAGYRAWIKRGATTDDILAGTTVAVGYGYLSTGTFGTGPAVSITGYVAGLTGLTRFGFLLEPNLAGSDTLRIGGHYDFAISDVGPADVLVNLS